MRTSSVIFNPDVVKQQSEFLSALTNRLQNQNKDEEAFRKEIEKDLPLVEETFIDSHYDFQYLLGEGATSQVFSAEVKETKELVAIKIVDLQTLLLNRSLLREIRVMKELDHPNIIKLKAVHRTSQHLYIVMERAEGEALFDVLVSRKSYTEADARTLVKEILSAIAYMHSKGIAHRDMKPENILYKSINADEHQIKIVDFGFASSTDDGLQTPLGTLGYKAPELVKKEQHSMAVDCWSLGVITYILLCGFPPFFSCQSEKDNTDFLFNTPFWYFFNKQTPELENAILSGNHDFPEEFWKNVSAEAKSFVNALLQVDVSKRMTAADALQHAWIKETIKPSLAKSEPLKLAGTNTSVAEVLKATKYATLQRRSLNIPSLLGKEARHTVSMRDLKRQTTQVELKRDRFNNSTGNIVEEIKLSNSNDNDNSTHVIPTATASPVSITKSPSQIMNMGDHESSFSDNESDTSSSGYQTPVINEKAVMTPIIRAGWAELKGLSVFSKRWLILYDGVLCFFKSDKDDPSDVFGVINLSEVKVYLKSHTLIEIVHPQKKPIFSSNAPGSKKKLPSIVLHHRHHAAILKVPQNEELGWLADLQKAIDGAKKNTAVTLTLLDADRKELRAISPVKRRDTLSKKEEEKLKKEEEKTKKGEEKQKKEEEKNKKGEEKKAKKDLRRTGSGLSVETYKQGFLEFYTNSKWKLRRVSVNREKLSVRNTSIIESEPSNRRKSLKTVDITLDDVTALKSDFSKDISWIPKGFKSSDISITSDYFMFSVMEKGKTYYYFRTEDKKQACEWMLALGYLKDMVPLSNSVKSLIDHHEKESCLEMLYKNSYKGGLIQVLNGDRWLYNPTKGSLAPIGEEEQRKYLWNGRELAPEKPSNYGAASWDGSVLEWKDSEKANPLHRFRWSQVLQEFRSENSSWRWKENSLISEFGKCNVEAIGDLPPVLVLCVQLLSAPKQ